MLKNVSIEGYASIFDPIALELGKRNYIVGKNEAGKSAICEAIRILFDYNKAYSSYSKRYSKNKVVITGEFTDENNNNIEIKRVIILKEKRIINDSLIINNSVINDYNYISSKFKVFSIDPYDLKRFNSGKFLAHFCIKNLTGWDEQIRKEHIRILESIAKNINENPNRLVDYIKWKPDGALKVKLWDKDNAFYYSNLSTGEQLEVCAEITLTLSKMFLEYRNVLILFDNLPTKFSANTLKNFITRIDKINNPNIQFIFTSWEKEKIKIVQPDCIIKIRKQEKTSKVFDICKKTPQGIKSIENMIIKKYHNKEDEFINTLILPLLSKMKFSNVKRVSFHGPGELGIDIGPFLVDSFEWRYSIYGAQVKACKLNATSSGFNNINTLINEIEKAMNNHFYLDEFNSRVKLDYVLAIASQYPTNEALQTFYSRFENERKIILITPDKLAKLIWKYGITF